MLQIFVAYTKPQLNIPNVDFSDHLHSHSLFFFYFYTGYNLVKYIGDFY